MGTGITMTLRYHLACFSGDKVVKLCILRFTVRTKNICHKEMSPENKNFCQYTMIVGYFNLTKRTKM